MSDTLDMAERHGRILERLSELGLSLAEAAHERAMAAETPKDLRDMTLAFHRISRSLRQTLALEARLARLRAQVEREAAQAADAAAAKASLDALYPSAAPPDAAGVRKDRVRRALARLIWEEAERDEEEVEILTEDLNARLDEAGRREDFDDIPIETLILQLKADMGLEGDLTLTACAAPAPNLGPSPELASTRAAPNSS